MSAVKKDIIESARAVKNYTVLKIPTIKFCPVTGNQPMRCTRAGWDVSCRKFQALEKNSYEKISTRHDHLTKYCSICMGDYIPDNVTFIDIPQGVEITCDLRIPEFKKPLTEVKEMAGRRYTAGNCECCGKKRNLTSHHGKAVCSSCINFRISAKNSPELVIDALREFGNLPDGKNTFQPELNDYVTLTQYDSMRNGLNEKIGEFEREKIDTLTALVEAEAKVEDHAKEIEELNIVVETLKEAIRVYQSEEDARLPEQSGLALDADVLQQIAWNLAEGTIAGTITGVSLEDIRRLRALV